MKLNNDGDYEFRTAGWSARERLVFNPGLVLCGGITDGVAFRHDDGGNWVVSYADLMEMARLATEVRAKTKRNL